MRRIALALLLGAALLTLGACGHWNWNDPLHPRPCPRVTDCPQNCCPVNM